MRIDKLSIRNFKKFTEQEFDFHRQFTLLAGENVEIFKPSTSAAMCL